MLVSVSVSLFRLFPFHQHQRTNSSLHGTELAQNFHHVCTLEQTHQEGQLTAFDVLDMELDLLHKGNGRLNNYSLSL